MKASTLLIVDDRPDNLFVMKEVVGTHFPQCNVLTANSALEGLDILAHTPVDVVLSDVQMPDMDGIEFCRRINSNERTASCIPIILITAHKSTPQLRSQGLDAGASDFISKPIDNVELTAKIKVMLRIRHAEEALRENSAHLEEVVAQRTRQLVDSTERFQTLLQSLNDIVWTATLDEGEMIYINPAVATIYGLPASDFMMNSKRWHEAIHPEDRWLIKDRARKLRTHGHAEVEYRILRPDGAVRWIQDRSSVVSDNQGTPVRLGGIASDITVRKQAEQILKDQQEELASIYQNAPIIMLLVNSERKVQKANRQAELFTGTEEESMLGLRGGEALRCLYALSAPDGCGSSPNCDNCAVRKTMISTLETGQPHYQIEATLPFIINGKKEIVTFLMSTLRFNLKNEPMVLVSILDITDRIRAEKEQHRLVAAIEQANEAIVIANNKGVIQYVNKTTEVLSGQQREHVIGRHWDILRLDAMNPEACISLAEQVSHGEVWRGHLAYLKEDGSQLQFETNVSPVRDVSGKIIYYVSVTRDVTREAELEAQLLQAQKMEAIGTLAGGIAHDFNNILQALLGYVELAEMAVSGNPDGLNYLKEIRAAGIRAADLVKQILAFSRHVEQERCLIHLPPMIAEVLKLLRGTLPTTIEIQQNIQKECRPILGDPSQIHQILMNLGTNAYHAMREKGGVLKASLDSVHLNGECAQIGLELSPGDYAKITVEDSGCGMSPETLNRIFEPYFSTKKKNEGTGLGLAIAHGIIKSHGGGIKVESTLGKGSVFSVFLPLDQNHIPSHEPPDTEREISSGTARILLVDDEPSIIISGKRALEILGYQVTIAENGKSALEIFQVQPTTFDLVITDQTMPFMTGFELAQKILQLRPDIPIILCTGFSESVDEDDAKAIGVQYISKPVTLSELSQAIRKVTAQLVK